MPNALYLVERMEKPINLTDHEGKLILIEGHIGREVEARFIPSGKQISKTSVAISWGKRGEPDQVTLWCNLVAWEDKAELLDQYGKGQAISCVGKVSLNRWNDREGNPRITPEITIWSIAKPDYKKREQPPQQQSKPAGSTTSGTGRQDEMPPVGGGLPEEEIPF